MPFKSVKIKTFQLEDLKGRNVNIRSFTNENIEIILAIDTDTGDLFLLKEILHPIITNLSSK